MSVNRHNPSHVADDFEDSSVEEEPYAYQYNEAEQGEDDGNDDPHSQKRSIKKWTAEEVRRFSYLCFLLVFRPQVFGYALSELQLNNSLSRVFDFAG